MEAYDAAVLSYAMATSTGKLKPGLLGMMPQLLQSQKFPEESDLSLTPPPVNDEPTTFQLLAELQQTFFSKGCIHLQQLIELCSSKDDPKAVTSLEILKSELRQACKANPGAVHLLKVSFDGDDAKQVGGSLKTEGVCRALDELFRMYNLSKASNLMKRQF